MSQLAVELPAPLSDAVKRLADESKQSLDDFVRATLADRVEWEVTRKALLARAARADLDAALAVLAQAPDVPPMPGDELPDDVRRHVEEVRARRAAKT